MHFKRRLGNLSVLIDNFSLKFDMKVKYNY